MAKISLFIPTFNALDQCNDVFRRNLEIINQAKFYRVLIIDSSSTDDTLSVVKSYSFEYHTIPQNKFDHGATRQKALELLGDSNIIIYMTQDALLEDINSIKHLATPLLEDHDVAACYGRQLAHDDADPFAAHLRKFNYSDKSYVRNYAERCVYGMRCIFSSDAFCAYKVSALNQIKGFPKHIIFGEDMYIFARILQSGFKVAYSAEAICYHSHNYTIKQDFKRYFDIGVFHRSENWILQDFGTASKQGIKFVLSELIYLRYRPWLWFKSIAKFGAKYFGYKLGYNYDIIGVRLCRKLTNNQSFWW